MKNLALLSFLLSFAVVSCETDIDLSVPVNEVGLVVDASIEQDQFAKVSLTETYPYTQVISLDSLLGLVVDSATVVLSDGLLTDTLEFTIDPKSFPPVYYKGTNPALMGQVGRTYFLTIIAGEDTATASTSIPEVVSLDSLAFEPEGDEPEFGRIRVWFRDPPAPGNHYRVFARTQAFPDFAPLRRSVFEDRIVNGDTIFFDISKPDPLPFFLIADTLDFDERRRYTSGDTVQIKFCSITRESYSFIRTFEAASGSFENPFSAPTFVKGNVEGAIGGFVGYGASYHTYIVP